jgi:citrate lyase subunit beta/citryl-CoA lyase
VSPPAKYLRSYLYVPGNRGDLLAKVHTAGADAIVIDLEDAVPQAEKRLARGMTCSFLRGGPPVPVYVRINAGQAGLEDAAALPATVTGIRVPKADDPETVAGISAILDRAGEAAKAIVIHPLIESVRGFFQLDELAASSPRVERFIFGAGDFTYDMGGERTPERRETLYSRSQIVLRSRYLGLLPPIAHVFSPIADLDGLERASREDRALGFYGRSCIHPRQVPVINAVFAVSDSEIATANAIVDGYGTSAAAGYGAAVLKDGTFVDEAVAKRAQRLLDIARIQRAGSKT